MTRVRARSGGGDEQRCPYCHDLLQAAGEELIECPGCRTVHHGGCIAELGRCTVLGCAQPITREALPLPPAWESPARRQVRERASGRASEWVRAREQARASGRLEPPLDHSARSRALMRRGLLGLFTSAAALTLAIVVAQLWTQADWGVAAVVTLLLGVAVGALAWVGLGLRRV